MTQQMKVTINQWLLVVVSAVFGFWGCYKVLAYRVGEHEEKITSICEYQKEYEVFVETRFEADRKERQANADNSKDIKHTLGIMQKDIDLILKKLP